MRNSGKRRTASLAVAAVGAAVLAITIATHRGISPIAGSWFAIVIASFFVTLLSFVGTLVFHTHVRWQQKLLRGDKRLAQWELPPADWEQFRANDKQWRSTGRPNALKLRKEVPTKNVAVIIAQDSLMVDDDFFSLGALRGLQWIPETPASLEYNMVTYAKNGTVKWNIRLPVAVDAEQQARAVWDYVHRPVLSSAEQNIRRLRFFRTFGLVCVALSGFALILARSYYVNRVQSPLLWVFVAGFAGLPFGLCVAALCQWQLRAFIRQKPSV